MFYRKDTIKTDQEAIEIWHVGCKISLPDGTIVSEEEKENKYGWQCHEEQPKEYLKWLEKQNEI
jgi:hypothetical protein